ncbi:cation transport regulator-like protein 2 [Delphinella strobiligena]|nr:cation transport regulator-like protein 2 [Delphinella strobiligena]
MAIEDDLWLFGYGSLIWKPPPHFDKRIPGYVEGYVRRFWQVGQRAIHHLEDHRGTPEAPGRVATLIDRSLWESLTDQHATAPPQVWGAAYRIPGPKVAEVREYLDIREINGYSIQYAQFHVSKHYQDQKLPPINCLVYIGLPDNPQFLGPQDPQALAEHIVRSRGPSGENKDYLYELDTALSQLSSDSHDEHIHDLARRCREVEGRVTAGGEIMQRVEVMESELRKVGSTNEQEEIEK